MASREKNSSVERLRDIRMSVQVRQAFSSRAWINALAGARDHGDKKSGGIRPRRALHRGGSRSATLSGLLQQAG
jgi:hypothetical protein